MTIAPDSLPDDITALKRIIADMARDAVAVQTEIAKLKFQPARCRRVEYGRSSEKLAREVEQLELAIETLQPDQAERRAAASPAVAAAIVSFTKYGLLHGTVIDVSADSIDRSKPPTHKKAAPSSDSASEPPGRELVYAAHISLDRTSMDIDGKEVRLSPGMAVTVEIKTGAQRVITYLLSPLMRYKQESLHER